MNKKKTKPIGRTIKLCRQYNGLSQSELGEKVGFAKKTAGTRIGQYEGERIYAKPQITAKLARLLGIHRFAISRLSVDSELETLHTIFNEKVVYITITAKTKEDMISQYNFTRKQQEALDTLLEQDEVLISIAQSLAVSDRAAQDILKNLPDSLSAERKKVIKAACSLVDKVNYFWGGKSSDIGWDSEWGKLKTVSAEGSKTTGTKRPFGLDCSGFVTWSFINSGFNASAIGHGTKGQIAKCSRISWGNTQAGDLAFYGDLSHVGIIAGKDADGNILVIHCSSGNNNVVITTNSGFGFAARPRCY